MKRLTRYALAIVSVATLSTLGMTSASAMGSGNPYQDMQTGVTYTVYQPSYVGGLKVTHVGSLWDCEAGTEQNVTVTYGKASKANVTVFEGNPICSDPAGDGKQVSTIMIQGAKAVVDAYCDPSNRSQWKNCSTRDVGRFGGSIMVTLPGAGNLRATNLVMVSSGSHPISYQSFIKMAKSMAPLVQSQQLVGGMTQCTQNELANAIEVGLSKGTVLVSVDKFGCKDGWAYAIATTGDGKGHDITQTFIFEAEGQFWIPKTAKDVCGTVDLKNPGNRPADSQVPAGIWSQACNTN